MVVDIFLVYQFIRRLVTPFKDWDAFKFGIIDDEGNILRKRSELKTREEKESFRVFDIMILKLKRLLEKVPGGKSRLASYAAALWLIKEGAHYTEDEQDMFTEMSEEDLHAMFDRYLEEIANVAGGGNVAGLPPDDPPVHKKKKKARLVKYDIPT